MTQYADTEAQKLKKIILVQLYINFTLKKITVALS